MANIVTVDERTSFNTNITDTTTGLLYQAVDDDGPTYYYVGNPTDNWVKFANKYWRIIRINGDGTIRMIYAGTDTSASGLGYSPATGKFNTLVTYGDSYDTTHFVGYMYTSGNVHGLGSSSLIKGEVDNWYASNLASYASYIDTNAGFCGDRSGAAATRISSYAPSFKCEYKDNSGVQVDLYTLSSASKGNKKLNYPIGLITADEVLYAGGVSSNSQSYLYSYNDTNRTYWTITPAAGVKMYTVANGGLATSTPDSQYWGIKPVINLRADLHFKAGTNGTKANPYEIS